MTDNHAQSPTFDQFGAVQELSYALARVVKSFDGMCGAGPAFRRYPFAHSLDELRNEVQAWADDILSQIHDYEEGPCTGCSGRGWDVFETTRGVEVQRCDDCGRLADDMQAAKLAIRILPEALARFEQAVKTRGA